MMFYKNRGFRFNPKEFEHLIESHRNRVDEKSCDTEWLRGYNQALLDFVRYVIS